MHDVFKWVLILAPATGVMTLSLWSNRKTLIFLHHVTMASIERLHADKRQWISIGTVATFIGWTLAGYAYFLITLSGALWGYWSYWYAAMAPLYFLVGTLVIIACLVLLVTFEKKTTPAHQRAETEKGRLWRAALRARLREAMKPQAEV